MSIQKAIICTHVKSNIKWSRIKSHESNTKITLVLLYSRPSVSSVGIALEKKNFNIFC